MKASTKIHLYFARFVWNPLPGGLQKTVSRLCALFYRTRVSRFLIKPFCQRYSIGDSDLARYRPASGLNRYRSFQDFFTRKLVQSTPLGLGPVWPCQGYVCDFGRVGDVGAVLVKGHLATVPRIFDCSNGVIPADYFFVNIFLHNHHYHRLHAPVSGVISEVHAVPGQLTFLRPWLYSKSQISEPSFRNERIIVRIDDEQSRPWFLSFVGGMGVGQIRMSSDIKIGAEVSCGQEMAVFLLGSTCCMAIPDSVNGLTYMKPIEVGHQLNERNLHE